MKLREVLDFIDEHPWWSIIFVMVIVDGLVSIFGK